MRVIFFPRSYGLRVFFVFCAALCFGLPIQAADYPSAPVRVVIPYPPGAGVDIALRLMAPRLQEKLKQSIVIDNRAGAGAIIGTDYVAKAAPDGYTIGITDAGPIAINPAIYQKLPYEPTKDFNFVTLISTLPTFLLVSPSLHVKSVQEFVALAKSKPNTISYASGGTGTTSHLAMEMLKSQAGIDLLHIPYKGTAPAITAVLSGEPPVMFGNLLSAKPYVQSKRLLALASASATPTAALPNVPSLAQAGVPGYDFLSWFGVIVPAETPAPIVDRLRQAFHEVLAEQQTRDRLLSEGGMEATPSTSAAFEELVKKQIRLYGDVARKSGIKTE